MEQEFSTPRYQQIAIDIARRIAKGRYQVGERIYSRSSLASQYGVSSETTRRAILVLSDLGIVEATKGSGVTILSYEKAVQYAELYERVNVIEELRQSMKASIHRQSDELVRLSRAVDELVEQTEQVSAVNPFLPFRVQITQHTPYLNQSVNQLQFWQNTSATVIAIEHEHKLILSPGPYAALNNGDVLYFVGDEGCLTRVRKFLYPEEGENTPKQPQ